MKKVVPTLLSLLLPIALSLFATTARATLYYTDNTHLQWTIGASTANNTVFLDASTYGIFYVNLENPGANFFFGGDNRVFTGFSVRQIDSGIASYDSATRIFKLRDASVEIAYQADFPCSTGTGCLPPAYFRGKMNLEFYLEENLEVFHSVGSNYIDVESNSTDGLFPTSSPSRMSLAYYGAVPLPATAWLLGSGLLGLALRPKRSKNFRSI